MKKILAFLLAGILTFTSIPLVSFAKEQALSHSDNTYIEVISDSAPLRTGPGEKYDTILHVQKGDCLIVTGQKENEHGNTFFICQLGNHSDSLYLFSSHAILHEHTYNVVSNEISVCNCGEYILNPNSSLIQTNALAATTGSLLPAGAIAVAGSLSSAGTAISAAAASAFPFVAITAISGLLIYMAVSASGAQVNDVVVFSSELDIYEHLESEFNFKAPYHKACLVPGSAVLLIAREGMDLNEANKYLKSMVTSISYAAFNTITKQSMVNIWCWSEIQAVDLGIRFSKNGPDYEYGSSSYADCCYEDNLEKYPNNIYFKHFHLWHRPYSLSYMLKIDNAHIFFDLPTFVNAV